jgi:CrcB protein
VSLLLCVAVFGMGGVGSVVRHLVHGAVTRRFRRPRPLPIGIFVVNVSGALVLGVLAGLSLPHDAALLAGTALVGAYTTFSTWLLETQQLAEDGRRGAAMANLLVSLVLGVGAAALGRAVAGG